MPRIYYPIFLDLAGRRCVVVGGGAVAERKARALVDGGAAVTVVSPLLTEALQSMAEGGTIGYVPRGYKRGDLEGSFLVIAATDDADANSAVWEEASELGILANVSDRPEMCNFILPSVLRRGGLSIAVGTGGASPALARKIRTDLEGRIGPEYAGHVRVLEILRAAVMSAAIDPGRRRRLLESAAESSAILERLKSGESPEVVAGDLIREFNLSSDATGGGSRENGS